MKAAPEMHFPGTNKDTIYTKGTECLQNNIRNKNKHPVVLPGAKVLKLKRCETFSNQFFSSCWLQIGICLRVKCRPKVIISQLADSFKILF